jgi:hypothetical protein
LRDRRDRLSDGVSALRAELSSDDMAGAAESVPLQHYSRRNTLKILLGATLVTSAVHFIDNAFRLDLYPGPPSFTRSGVLVVWLALPILAGAAYRSGSRAFLVGYGLLGFAGFAHYYQPHVHPVPLRCLATIAAEAIASAALIAYVLFWGPTPSEETPRRSR